MPEFFIYKNDEGDITNLQVLADNLKELEAGRYLVRIERSNKRTLDQNAYLHAGVIPCLLHALRDMGYNDVENVKDAKVIFKGLFCKKDFVNEETGEVLTSPQDTRDMSTIELSEAIEKCGQWLAEKGYYLPPPKSQLRLV